MITIVLLYSPEIDPFLEDLINLADRVFYFEESPRESPQIDRKGLAENEESEDI